MRPDPVANEQGRRGVLRRFGYGASDLQASEGELRSQWDLLRADFNTASKAVPALDQLPPEARARAEAYLRQRHRLDGLMDGCDAAHLRILREGPQPDLVEAYAAARDSYEDAVEEFGELRRQVQEALDVRKG
jgi:hypothetical protein